MDEDKQKKILMDGYVGVKFDAVRISPDQPSEAVRLFPLFQEACNELNKYGMTPANGGNISLRLGNGIVISSSGSNLGCIEKEELVFVESCDADKKRVLYHGPLKPSSETIMHWLIYRERPEADALIHAHDELATRCELTEGLVDVSCREEPYGTLELAQRALETFRGGMNIIVLNNHGYVAAGKDLNDACGLIIRTHKILLERAG